MSDLSERAEDYLKTLTAFPDRHVGGEGNRAATAFFAETATRAGLEVARHRFDCLEWTYGRARLDLSDCAGEAFELQVGPYSHAADLSARLTAASSVEQLETDDIRDTVVLLHGEIASGQLMPKNFTFYNPASHQRVYRALECYCPAAVLAATGTDPQMVGSQYPFPLFEDGDLEIPSAYLKDADGERLLAHQGETAHLRIESERIPTTAEQIIATRRGSGAGRVVVFAHIDSRKDSPGALDNASGVAVLLTLAELLSDYADGPSVELVPLNGEDNYAAPGEMVWLAQNEGRFDEIVLGINIDDAGMKGWDTHVSFYGCPDPLKNLVLETLRDRAGFAEGPQWFQSDHAMFGMYGVPAIAIATAGMYEFMVHQAHSERDTVDLADPDKIAAIARFVQDVIDAAKVAGWSRR